MRSADYRERLFDNRNIFLALYSVHSYILNQELLTKEDKQNYEALKDIFNEENIQKWVDKVTERLKELIECDDYLQAKVYFKPKKFEKGKAVFRPIHHSELLDQITAVAMLNLLIYDFSDEGKVGASDLSRLIPHNFYGNRVAYDIENLFVPWEVQYKKYNKIANDHYRKYHENLEYKWEVNLDLKNFFPSVDPSVLYQYVASKLPVNLSVDNRKVLLKILEKLIFIEIDELDEADLKRYRGEEASFSCRFAQGIPQGLPQSYFFANLLMIEVEKQYKKVFPNSKIFFYVDDSVIFTNDISDEKDLSQCISSLNESIQKWQNELKSFKLEELSGNLYQYVKDRESSYGIKVHELGEKSTASNIVNSKPSEIYLNCIGRETSKTSFELNTGYSDEENMVLLNKTEQLNKAVENELEDIKTQIEKSEDANERIGLEAYKKKLIRYKKFFKYRNFELTIRANGVDEAVKMDFQETLETVVKNKMIAKFFEDFTEDIFSALLNLVLREMTNSGEDTTKLLELLEQLNSLLFNGDNKKTSYVYQAFSRYYDDELDRDIEDVKYSSLKKKVTTQMLFYKKKKDDFRRNHMKEFLFELKENSILVKKMDEKYAKMVGLVDANSSSIRRMLLNAYISGILGFEISDEYLLHKKINRNITYAELRILEMLRSKKYKDKIFFDLLESFFDEEFECVVDYSIFQVLGYFRTYISDVDKLDNLILVHKYTCDTWKNGSKHLYFYTLHNQEHAVDLVQNIVKLVRAIDYIDIKRNDYYILFMACYLHDISMVTIPLLDLIQDDSYGSDEIYTNFINDIRKNCQENNLSDKSVKKMLRDYYLKVDEFYENNVRSTHAKDSAKEIRSRKELSFIDLTLREIVAEVSEAHGHNIADIYYKKSFAHKKNWSEKYTKILLRLADLLDMSNYRVSRLILNHNINNMGEVSRFHWLSHMVTKGYTLNVKYGLKKDIKENYLSKESIIETIQLMVNVDLPQFTRAESHECNEMNLMVASNDEIVLECGVKCQNQFGCNFLCKWFVKKNNYLFTELDALRKYLNSVPDNYFDTRIEVKVRSSAKSALDSEQFSYLSKYVEGF